MRNDFILAKLNNLFPDRDLVIQKSDVGYPILLIDGKEQGIAISFSHHYRYVSYSFQISK